MRIAEIVERDLPELSGLYQQLQQHDASLERMAAALEIARRDVNHVILGASVDGVLVGTVLGVVCRMIFGQGRSFMVIEDVVVNQKHRRAGIGGALMRAMEKRAWERDCSYIMLVTDEDRAEARRFYDSLGYRSERYRAFKKSL